MGHKINPISYRLQVNKKWPARWFFAGKGEGSHTGRYFYHRYLAEDEIIRRIIREKIGQAGIASVEIERTTNNLRVLIRAARPGFVIGQGGKGIEDLSKAIEKELRKIRAGYKTKSNSSLSVNVEELKRTDVSATYIAQQIAWDLERRMTFRRTIRKYLEQMMQSRDVKGAKIMVSGRLDGAEIARTESMKQGPLPLQTLRANIDYGVATATTTYGTIGVKIWVYKGEVFEDKQADKEKEQNRRNEHRNSRYR